MACAEWVRVAPMLRLCGLVTEAERGSLVALCQQWSIYLAAQAHVRKHGMLVRHKYDPPTVNPHIRIGKYALQACLRLWSELGLTPTSRVRLTAGPGADAAVAVSRWEGVL